MRESQDSLLTQTSAAARREGTTAMRQQGSHASDDAPVVVIGDPALLRLPLLAFVCSRQVPPRLVLPAYDLACALRDAGVPLCGGFHTPVERDALGFLLKGSQPLVLFPARSLAGTVRLPAAWQREVAAGRLALCSRLPAPARRVSKDLAAPRNAHLAEVCAGAVVVHASPGGATEAWCHALLAAGKPLWTLDDPANNPLLALGARPCTPDRLPRLP